MNNFTKAKLSDICEVNFGQHLKTVSNEGVMYLQVKNFSENGVFLYNVENFINSDTIKQTQLLQQDDILFVSKGMKFFAFKYDNVIGKAIASSIFYVLKIDRNLILPDYLISILNHPKSLAYFYGVSAGSSIPSIRKKELMDFEFSLPSLKEQKNIADIYDCHQKELSLLNKIKENKQLLFNQLIYNLTK